VTANLLPEPLPKVLEDFWPPSETDMPFEPTDYLPYDFANRRHIGPSPAEMAEMFEVSACPRSTR
jgi:hypothetical protein